MTNSLFLKSWRRPASLLPTIMLVLTLVAGVPRGVQADAGEEAARFVRGFGDTAIAMLSDPALSPAEREQEFRHLLKQGFHMEVIARFVLGRHWRRASEAERAEFGRLFEDYVVAAYARQLGSYGGEQLKVGKARTQSESIALVASRITRAQGEAYKVEWRLRRDGESWRIIDVVVEGVSMASTYRSEFSSVIAKHGGQMTGLLEILHAALRSSGAGTGSL